MGKTFSWAFFLLISIPIGLYSNEPHNKKPEIILTENELIVVTQLVGGLDLDKMAIIEKGITVKLLIRLSVYKKNYIFDEIVPYFISNNISIEELEFKKELNYNYITRNYIIKNIKNYSSDTLIEKYFSGEDLRESYQILKAKFFEKKVIFYIDLTHLKLVNGSSFYVELETLFQAVTTIPNFPIPIPNTFNFKTIKIKSEVFKR
ncbi:MAG: hypothetical protein OEV44_12295 [Spirochaetota bacterium]|nr:hypothetical protein [Spirochaetota bacterium]